MEKKEEELSGGGGVRRTNGGRMTREGWRNQATPVSRVEKSLDGHYVEERFGMKRCPEKTSISSVVSFSTLNNIKTI